MESLKVAFVAMETLIGAPATYSEPAVLLPGAREVIEELGQQGYWVVYLADVQEYKRPTIVEWLDFQGILTEKHGSNGARRVLLCKAGAFSGLDSAVWLTGVLQSLACAMTAKEGVLFAQHALVIARMLSSQPSGSFDVKAYERIAITDWVRPQTVVPDTDESELTVSTIRFTRTTRAHPDRGGTYYESGIVGTMERISVLIQLIPPRRHADSGWTAEVRTQTGKFFLWLDVHDHYTPEEAVERAVSWAARSPDKETREVLEFVRGKAG